MIWRDWVQPNTQGMARSADRPSPLSGRVAGRDPILRSASSVTGVACMKYSTRPGASTSERYFSKAAADTWSIAASHLSSTSGGCRDSRCSSDASSTAESMVSRLCRASVGDP